MSMDSWHALCNDEPQFTLQMNHLSNGIQAWNPVIKYYELLQLKHVDTLRIN